MDSTVCVIRRWKFLFCLCFGQITKPDFLIFFPTQRTTLSKKLISIPKQLFTGETISYWTWQAHYLQCRRNWIPNWIYLKASGGGACMWVCVSVSLIELFVHRDRHSAAQIWGTACLRQGDFRMIKMVTQDFSKTKQAETHSMSRLIFLFLLFLVWSLQCVLSKMYFILVLFCSHRLVIFFGRFQPFDCNSNS